MSGKARSASRKPALATTKRQAKKSVAKRTAARRPAARPANKVKIVPVRARVRTGAATAPAAPPFSGAITGASARHLALFEVVRARVTLHASLQGLLPGSAEEPVEPGGWTVRETLLRLIHSDHEFLVVLGPALHGIMPEWLDEDDDARDRRHDPHLAPLRGLDFGAALRRLQTGRQDLMSALESLPEEPVSMWGPGHALGRVVAGICRHDLHHANLIKHWRTSRDV